MKGVNHRGYNSTSKADDGKAPENTLPAYRLSAQRGFRYVETDVAFTSDNVPVLLHDATIDRTSNGTGSLKNLTFEQVRSYDFGSWKHDKWKGTKIPSLEEFLQLCRDLGLYPYIEIKDSDVYTSEQIKMIVDMVNGYGLADVTTYISFKHAYLVNVKEHDPRARLGYVIRTITSAAIDKAKELMNDSNRVFVDSSDTSDAGAELCRSAGMPLEIWTVNTKPAILALNKYVSGVTSNVINAEHVCYERAIQS